MEKETLKNDSLVVNLLILTNLGAKCPHCRRETPRRATDRQKRSSSHFDFELGSRLPWREGSIMATGPCHSDLGRHLGIP